jgi:hypothetical protein
MPHVRLPFSSYSAQDAHCVWISGSFLWADPTRDALQFLAVENPGAVIRQEGIEEGIWITVDPIPGCMVCNIGESQWAITIQAKVHRLIDMW